MNSGFVRGVGCICLSAYLIVAYCPMHGQNIDDPADFGLISQGTVSSSGVSGSMVKVLDWTPVNGPIVREQLELNHKGSLMENRKEIRNG